MSVLKLMPGDLTSLQRILYVLTRLFPNFGAAVINVIATLKAGEGATAAFKVGLSGIGNVIKAHPILTIAAAMAVAVTLVSKFSHAQEEAIKKAEEQAQKSKEVANKANEEAKSLDDLIAKYKELKSTDKFDAETRAKIREIQNEIVGLVGDQADNLDLVNGKLDNELDKLKEAQRILAETNLSDYEDSISDAVNTLETSMHTNFDLGENSFNLGNGFITSEVYDKAKEIAKKYGARIDTDLRDASLPSKMIGFENVYDAYKAFSELMTYAQSIDDRNDYEWYKTLSEQNSEFEGYVDDIREQAKNLVSNLELIGGYESESVKSLDDYIRLRERITNDLSNNKAIKEALDSGAIDSNWISEQVDSYLDGFDQFSVFYDEYNTQITKLKNIESIADILTAKMGVKDNISDFTTIKRNIQSFLSDLSAEDSEIALSLVNSNKVKDISALKAAISEYKTAKSEYDRLLNEFVTKGGDTEALQQAYNALIKYVGAIETINIESETTAIKGFNTAISESYTSAGMGAESIAAIKERFSELSEYDMAELFTKTSAGIRLNVDAANELEEKYEKIEKTKLDNKLQALVDEYNFLKVAIDKTNVGSKDYIALMDEKASKYGEIEQLKETIAQYQSLTSAYNKWQSAKSAGNNRDEYENLGSAYEGYKKMIEQGWGGTNELSKYLDLMLNSDQRTKDNIADFDKLTKKIEGTNFSLMDFFQYDDDNNLVSDGLFNFLDAVKAKLGDEFVKIGKDGSYSFDFTGDNIERVAKALGMTTEGVRIFEDAMIDAGFDVKFEDLDHVVQTTIDDANKALETLRNIGGKRLEGINLDFDFNSTDINDYARQIEEAQKLLDRFKGKDGKINFDLKGATEARDILATLVLQKQKLTRPEFMSIDTENLAGVDKGLANSIKQAQDLQLAIERLEFSRVLNLDTSEATQKIGEIISSLQGNPEMLASLQLDDASKNAVKVAIENINASITAGVEIPEDDVNTIQTALNGIDTKALGIETDSDDVISSMESIQKFEFKDKTFSVGMSGFSLTSQQLSSIIRQLSQIKDTDINIGVNGVTSGSGSGSGGGGGKRVVTTYADGTAFAHGDWGTKTGGVALGGERGMELLVRNGKYYTIGKDSAEFFKYRKGDIIFNADQTEQILKYGKIISGTKRGDSYAEGTAFDGGTLDGGSGSGGSQRPKSGNTTSAASVGDNSSSSSSKDKSDDSTDKINYIEIIIARINRAIERLKTTATSAFKSLAKRLTATSNEMDKVNEALNIQNKAYDAYIKQANNVKLSASIKKLVREGNYTITEYDSDTAALINEYKEYYEAALECKDEIQQLNEDLAQLYKDKFELIEGDFDNKLSRMENSAKHTESQIDLLEARHYFVTNKYYKSLANQEQRNIEMLNNKYTALKDSFDEAISSGKIAKYSEEWYEMQLSIEDVAAAIDETTVSLAEYNDKMREINWSIFDYLQDRISQVTEESEFLIDLMSNSDLFDDRGDFSKQGLATAGLHAVNYNTYMSQADKYAKELQKINNQLAFDPADMRLIERREELLKLQQESIKNAEDEKQAIKSLVEEGIKIQLEALRDLIDKYTDSLDQAKSFYDYQNKIEEKTSNIAKIQKKLAAYQNNVSEETQAKIQKLQVELADAQKDLEQTEYEQYIADTKKLLDDMYSQYEEVLNERLDDINVLMSDMIDAINLNSGDIAATIREASENVGYTLTENMNDIWSSNITSSNKIVSMYGDNFTSILTSVNETLNSIALKVGAITSDKVEAQSISTLPTKNPTELELLPKSNNNSSDNNKNIIEKVGKSDKDNYGVALAIIDGNYGWGSGDERKRKLEAKGFNYNTVQGIVNKLWNEGYIHSDAWMGRYYGIKDLSPYHYKKFKLGGLVDYTGLAQLDGTPTRPELVLNAQDTENFISLRDTLRGLANTPLSLLGNNTYSSLDNPAFSAFAFDKFKRYAQSFEGSIGNRSTTVTFGDILIDHVEDYDDFVRQLKKDKKFEEFIRTMTIDRLNGGSSLAKNNINW